MSKGQGRARRSLLSRAPGASPPQERETEASRRRSKLPGFQSWLCDLLAGRPWPRGSAFASLRFPGDEAEATTDVERPQKTARAREETPTAPAVRVAVSRPTALPCSLAAAWRGFGAGSGGVVKFLAPPWGRCNPTFPMTDQSRCAPPLRAPRQRWWPSHVVPPPLTRTEPVFHGACFALFTRMKRGSEAMGKDWPRSHGQDGAEAGSAPGAAEGRRRALCVALHRMGSESAKRSGASGPQADLWCRRHHPYLSPCPMARAAAGHSRAL